MDLRTGAAFWPIKNGLISVYPPLERDETCDVAIVGAGITGALVAERLSQSGCDVVVLDRHDVATGSTAATTGLLLYETDTSLTELVSYVGTERAVRSWQLGRRAIDDIEALSQAHGCGFARRPSLYVASSRWDVKALKAECALRQQHGFDVDWMDRSAITAAFGFTRHGAIFSRADGEVDAYRLTHGLLAEASRRGARIHDRTNVTHVGTNPGGVTLETDRGPTVRARRLVVASGYEVAEQFGRDQGDLHSTWVFISEPVADLSWWRDRSLIWETRRPYTYLRTTSDGRVLVGGEDERWSRRHENTRLLRGKTERLMKRFSALFPDVRLEVAYAWAGIFGTTKDGLPYIGTVPEHPNTCFALGYGGNGITFSTIAADLIRDWWAGHHNPDAELFSFGR